MYCSWYFTPLLKLAYARALRVRVRLLSLFVEFFVFCCSIFVFMFRFSPHFLKGGGGVGSAQGLLDLLVLTDTSYGVSRGVGGCIAPVFGPGRCPVCGLLWVNCWCSRGV